MTFKKQLTLSVLGLLTACGAGGGGAQKANAWNSYYVQMMSELPTCEASIRNQLWYVEESTSFQVCGASGWNTVTVGNQIVSNQLLQPLNENFCTTYAEDVCYFKGGQLIKFADGTVTMLGSFQYFRFDGSVDTDSDLNTITVSFPPGIEAGFALLGDMVARPGTSGFRSVFLAWGRSSENLLIVFDANGNKTLDGADTVLAEVEPVNWN